MALPTVGTVFGVFRIFFVKNFVIHFVGRKNDPDRMSGSSQTYLCHSRNNIDPSTMVIRNLKNMRFFC